jgi:ribonuclease J
VAVTVKVEVLSGNRSIGGNFVKVEDGDRVIIFDQGIRFDVMKRFYAGFIAPRGLRELREIGAVPRVEWYNGAGAIYISHMHLDHLGLLSNIPARVEVYVPNLGIYELLEEKWSSSPSWLSMVPRKHYLKLCGLKPMEVDRNGVAALPVSHSAFPAYAFLYFGSDKTVLYTGDFRVEGFLDREEFEKSARRPGHARLYSREQHQS